MENVNSWVKLYRKTKDNGILKDPNAWALFTWLLLTVDKDTGKTSFGRFQIAHELGIKPNTVYKVVKRLEQKYGVISVKRQTVYTEVCIVQWAKYQSSSNERQTSVKSSSNDSNTLQEIKNTSYIQLTRGQKEKLIKDFPTLQVEFELEKFSAWQKANNKHFPNVLERFRLWLMDCKQKENQTPLKSLYKPVSKANPIISDPLFKNYIEVYHPADDNEMRKKMVLESQLNQKYSTFKYAQEWSEARKQIPATN